MIAFQYKSCIFEAERGVFDIRWLLISKYFLLIKSLPKLWRCQDLWCSEGSNICAKPIKHSDKCKGLQVCRLYNSMTIQCFLHDKLYFRDIWIVLSFHHVARDIVGNVFFIEVYQGVAGVGISSPAPSFRILAEHVTTALLDIKIYRDLHINIRHLLYDLDQKPI